MFIIKIYLMIINFDTTVLQLLLLLQSIDGLYFPNEVPPLHLPVLITTAIQYDSSGEQIGSFVPAAMNTDFPVKSGSSIPLLGTIG